MDTETALDSYQHMEDWPAEEALAAMLDSQRGAFKAVRQAIPMLASAASAAAERLEDRGRLVYCGAGSSGRIAVQDGVELLPTFGWPQARLAYLIAGGFDALTRSIEGAEDDAEAGAREAGSLGFDVNDVVIAVAASGTTRFTRAVQTVARRAGALTIALANNARAPLLEEADYPVLLHTGPEFLPGSTRMAAGTAQKIALNLFSTRLMTQLGRVYQGLMVDMVPSNRKLVARAHRMIAAITGLSVEDAARAWEAAGGSVKIAVLMHDGFTRKQAEDRLAAAGGRLDIARQRNDPDMGRQSC